MVALLAEKCAEEPIMYIEPWLSKPISTSTTTLVKGDNAVLGSVVINAKGTVASTVTIYDALTATGTPIATIDSLNLSGNFDFNVALSIGLTVVTTGTVAPNITITYR
jgi:hypothetical protein